MKRKEINRKQVLSSYFSYLYSNNKIKDFVKLFLQTFLFKYKLVGELKENIYFYPPREDFDNLVLLIKKSTDMESSTVKICKKIRINFIAFAKFIFSLLKNSKKIKKIIKDDLNKKISIQNTIYIKLWLFKVEQLEEQFKKISFLGVKNLIVLTDVLMYENALINVANEKKINTIILQHGFYIPSNKIYSIDNLNYRYVNAKYFLVWGNETKKMIDHYNNINVIICGDPRLKKESIDIRNKTIGVLCDAPRFHSYNQQMIDIAEDFALKLGFKVLIRLHPRDDCKYYILNKNISIFERNLDETTFILAHTSTMIFTMMLKHKCVFRFNSDISYEKLDKIKFSNLDELIKLYNDMNNLNFDDMLNEHYEYVGDESIKRYRAFFELSKIEGENDE